MSKGYWLSEKGITVRLQDLGESIAYRTFNRAVQVYAANTDVKEFEFVTAGDENVCALCDGFSGQRFRKGQFMPSLPLHIGCRCTWDVYWIP